MIIIYSIPGWDIWEAIVSETVRVDSDAMLEDNLLKPGEGCWNRNAQMHDQ